MNMKLATAGVLALGLAAGTAQADSMKPTATQDHSAMAEMMVVVKHGSLEISHIRARATPPKSPVGGGYLTIKNTGSESDFLIGGSASFAGRIEIHEMKMVNDVMKMRELPKGLEIPAGGEVVLKPGGYHVMFMKLKEPLVAGSMRPVTLEFAKAGKVDLKFAVQDMKTMMKHKNMHSGDGS